MKTTDPQTFSLTPDLHNVLKIADNGYISTDSLPILSEKILLISQNFTTI